MSHIIAYTDSAEIRTIIQTNIYAKAEIYMFFPSQRPGNVMPSQMRPPNNLMMPARTMNPMPETSNTPGILSRLLNSQSAAGAASQGGGGLSGALNNVQQILNVVQSGAPLVQEYGPMVKNLPAMYKMMKAFKDMESGEKSEESAGDASLNESEDESFESFDLESSNKNEEMKPAKSRKKPSSSGNGQSVPKLYI